MRIAVSATGFTLDDEVDPRFGRCKCFIIADPETMEFEVVENASTMAAGGAGISAAQAIVGRGVQAVLTGNCGPNAYQVLSSAGVQLVSGVSGKIKDAIEGYRSGRFKNSSQANVPDHFGMGNVSGVGKGAGKGGGMGCGKGRGMASGVTRPVDLTPQPQSPELELQALEARSQAMAQQLADIQRRIEGLKKK